MLQAIDVAEWIREKFRGQTKIRRETISVVADFTLIWNIFECIACGTDVNRTTLGDFSLQAARKISDEQLPIYMVEQLLLYYRTRYITHGEPNTRFQRLRLISDPARATDDERRVKEVLLGHEANLDKTVFAVLLIIQRLRNNLFHGVKQFDALDEQATNLKIAIAALEYLLDVVRPGDWWASASM